MSQSVFLGICGVVDAVGLTGSSFTGGSLPVGIIRYSFGNITKDVTEAVARACIARAFLTWENTNIGLQFVEVSRNEKPHILVEWEAEGPDTDGNPGNIAATGQFPSPPEVEPSWPILLHFDSSAHTWLDQNAVIPGLAYTSHDIQSIALHEIGHTLGLNHSQVETSGMYFQALYNNPSVSRVLTDDDITRVRSIYNRPHTWKSLPGRKFIGEPAVVSWSAERVDIFVRGDDNAVYQTTFNPKDPTNTKPWQSLGGAILDSPCAIQIKSNRIDLFARDVNDKVVHRWWDGTKWNPPTEWELLGGTTVDRPTAISWGHLSKDDEMNEAKLKVVRHRRDKDPIDLFARDKDNAIYHRHYNSEKNQWSPWVSLFGLTEGRPVAVSWSYGRIDLFVRGLDNGHLYHKYYDDKKTSEFAANLAWESLGGKILNDVSAVAPVENRLDIFITAYDGVVSHKAFLGQWIPKPEEWSAFENAAVGSPLGVSWAPGTFDVYVIRTGGTVAHWRYNGEFHTNVYKVADLDGKIKDGLVANPTSFGQLFARGTDGELMYLL